MGIEVEVPLTNVVADNKLEIAIPDNSSIVDTSTSIVAQVIPNSYVLSSAGMYSAGFSGATVPSWLQDAITSELADGTLDMRGLISSLQTLTSSLESGISQQLERIHNAEEAISASETSFVARLGSNQATVLALVNTKATKAEVEASVSNIIAAEFDSNAGAWFTDHISTYATDIATNASSLTTLSSTLNNSATGLLATADTANHFYTNTGYDPVTQSLVANAGYFGSIQASIGDVAAHITSVENVTVGNFVQWNGISAPKQGMFKLVGTSPNQVQYNYLGGLLGENNDGWVRTDASAATLGDAAYALANRTGALFNANEATPPTATGIGDIWVVTDRWYTASTGTTVSAIEYEAVVPATVPVTYYPRYGKATKRWSGTAWVLLSNGSTTLTNITWAAGASKLITAPDGSVTGWAFGDGSATQSEFKIKAQNFSISDGVTGYTPFSISGSNINFTGKVTFAAITDSSTYIPTISSVTTAQNTANSKVLPADVASAVNSNTTTINGGKITTGSITANNIAANTITADKISSYNLTSTNATIGNAIIGNASIQDLTIAGAKMANGAMGGIGYSAFSGGMSSTVTTYGAGLTSANTVVVGSFYFYNSSNKNINVSVTVAGRSGYTGGYTGYYAWGIFNGATLLYDYGWAPWNSVAIAGSSKYSLAANSGSTIYVRACVSTAGTTASLAGSIAITGIIV